MKQENKFLELKAHIDRDNDKLVYFGMGENFSLTIKLSLLDLKTIEVEKRELKILGK